MDYKTLSNNLGHATAAFTMDVYGHVSETMMQNGYSDSLKAFKHRLGYRKKEAPENITFSKVSLAEKERFEFEENSTIW